MVLIPSRAAAWAYYVDKDPFWPQSDNGEEMKGASETVSVAQQYQVLIRSKKFLGLDHVRPSDQQVSVKMARKKNSRCG